MSTYIHERETERTVTNEDGEVISRDTEHERAIHKTDKVSEEPYLKLYMKHVGRFFSLPESAMNVLLALCSHANVTDSLWAGRRRDSRGRVINPDEEPKSAKMYLNSTLKSEVCEVLGISMPTFNRRLKELCDKDILRRTGRGTYQLNPYIIARGNWADILELRATYDYVNGTVETEMVCRDEDTGEPVRVM